MQINKQTMSIMRKAAEEMSHGAKMDQAARNAIQRAGVKDPAKVEGYASEIMDVYRAGKGGDAAVRQLAADLGLANVSGFKKLSNSIQAVAEYLAATTTPGSGGGGTGPVE